MVDLCLNMTDGAVEGYRSEFEVFLIEFEARTLRWWWESPLTIHLVVSRSRELGKGL